MVVLSGHGRTQGSTFFQRYGETLPESVGSLIDRSQKVGGPDSSTEGCCNVNGLTSDEHSGAPPPLPAVLGAGAS